MERSFAHICETGGSRRCWLRGLQKVTKRYLFQAAARNLGVILRKLFGIGTARSLQGAAGLLRLAYFAIRSWEMLIGAFAIANVLRYQSVNPRWRKHSFAA
jgi:hypothetical protein